MNKPTRRSVLKSIAAAAAASALPGSIGRALAIPAHRRTGTIKDVQHIVILTQENRSFDHYFGTLRGVRGFADPRAIKLPNGKSVLHQPFGSGELLPFRPPVADLGQVFLPDPPHGWNDTHGAWNHGHHDQWVANKGVATMTHHTRADLPFHFALADAFTVCDAYHCSVMGPTDPNRYHIWTGWLGNDGNGGGPVITNAEVGYDWSSFPERLQQAGISWKVYQDVGVGLDAAGYWGWTDDAFVGNYGDNSLLYLHQYQNALPGSPLADGAKVGTNILNQNRDPLRLLDMFRADVRNGTLPQVSWIAAPEAFSEHPNWAPDFGAWYVSQFLDILTSHPDVWSKTAFFLHYDEEGGFFDHMVPPTPPPAPGQGASTVDLVNEIFPGDGSHPSAPYGLGMRVPMLVISPWSKGGWVNSQVFDHTSLIRFIETRFADQHPGLIESNITPWRRAVTGDLTSAFNFAEPDADPVKLPSTVTFLPSDKTRQPDYPVVPPANPVLPVQELGVRPARALPYELNALGALDTATGFFGIEFSNSGKAAAVFQARSGNAADAPRTYTVAPGQSLSGLWQVAGAADFDLAVHGPNGFFRSFKGSASGSPRANVKVSASYGEEGGVRLTVSNRAARSARVQVANKYTGRSVTFDLDAGGSASRFWSLASSSGWYDFVVTAVGDNGFLVQLAGHVEDGKDSISDPLMAGVRLRDE